MTSTPKIITIGGGKGGVGKSILATNLSIALAIMGQKIVLMDGDFGASNLHALLGLCNPPNGFQDLINKSETDPNSLLIETGVANLRFLSGAGDFPGSGDINLKNQNRLVSLIKNLSAETIIIDLGPGMNFQVIDFFNLGHEQIVVSTPEITSIMNTFGFIKSALFRKIGQVFKGNSEIQNLLDITRNPNVSEECYKIEEFKSKVQEIQPDSLEELEKLISDFQIGLVINRVQTKKDIFMGDHLIELAKKFLGIKVQYLGYVIESDHVRSSVGEMIPFLIKDPQSPPSKNLQQVISSVTGSEVHLIKKDGTIFVSKQIQLPTGWSQ